MVSGDLMVSAHLPGITGTSRWSAHMGRVIRAYDSSGAQRWAWQMTEGGDAVDDTPPSACRAAAISWRWPQWFGGSPSDAGGVEQWCNKSIGNVDSSPRSIATETARTRSCQAPTVIRTLARN